ncbi:MAG: hypothetical protein V3U93_02815 [Alphaproteobacteria bacterium]
MTVSTTTTKAIYNGDGSTTAFPTTFEFFDAADIEVIERVIATGAETVKTLSTDYTVSGGNGATGTVTAVTAPASTVQWAIRRKTPLTQQIDYVENDDFPAETHEQGLDRGVMIAQERQEELDRALKFPVSDAASLDPEIPNSIDRANQFLSFDAAGKPIASAMVSGTAVSAFMQTVLDDADAAAARATLETEGVKASAIASAATTDIWAATGDLVHITGTTTITSFGTASRAGIVREIIFDGALTLTHGANLDLPGAANIVTAAGDRALVRADTTIAAVVTHYQRAASLGGGGDLHGQCRLTKSGANLVLSRHNGTKLIIDGTAETIPPGGVTLAATGLTVGTTYNIYDFMSGGTMTLEASTTAHATDTTTGVEIKSGDGTRTLVGMARVITGPAWQDTLAQRFVRTWFNDPGIVGRGADLAGQSTTSTTFVELGSTFRVEWLTWLGEGFDIAFSGGNRNTSAAGFNKSNIGIDSATAISVDSSATSAGANDATSISSEYNNDDLTEGFHDARPLGLVKSGTTGEWQKAWLTIATGGR